MVTELLKPQLKLSNFFENVSHLTIDSEKFLNSVKMNYLIRLIFLVSILLSLYLVLYLLTNHLPRQNPGKRTPQQICKKEFKISIQNFVPEIEAKKEPNIQYEKLRRRIGKNLEETWAYLKNGLLELQEISKNSTILSSIKILLEEGIGYKRSLVEDIGKLAEFDGFSMWRKQEAKELSDLIQRRLKYLQRPKNCLEANKVTCSLEDFCAFGCQLHHAVDCLTTAYGAGRTFVLEKSSRELNFPGWETLFKPFTKNCSDKKHPKPGTSKDQIITLPYYRSNSFVPLTVPEDLAPRLDRLHGDPPVWWVGQFIKYLLRPKRTLKKFWKKASKILKFKRPIVGVHIKRLKGSLLPIKEYFSAAEEY